MNRKLEITEIWSYRRTQLIPWKEKGNNDEVLKKISKNNQKKKESTEIVLEPNEERVLGKSTLTRYMEGKGDRGNSQPPS